MAGWPWSGEPRSVLDRAAEDLAQRGSPEALGLVADTQDAAAVQGVFDELHERWNGELNVLINAVGPTVRGTFDDLTDDQWRQAVDEGVMGMVHCVRSALPLLRRASWARIVNFSAHSTQRQSVILPAYTAAKAMVTSISKNLSLLLAKDEIMVNVVSPGSIASEALRGWAESVGVDGSDPYALMAAMRSWFTCYPGRPDYFTHWGGAFKYAASVLGLPIGAYPHSRPPQAQLPDAAKTQIDAAYRHFGLVDS